MLSRMEAGVTAKEEEAVNSMAFLEERDIKENKKFAGCLYEMKFYIHHLVNFGIQECP